LINEVSPLNYLELTGEVKLKNRGPHDENWLKDQKELKIINESYQRNYENWYQISISEWKNRAGRERFSCIRCHGYGSFDIGGSFARDSCEYCDGRGKFYLKAEEYKRYKMPLEPRYFFKSPNDYEIIAGAKRIGIKN